MIEVEVRLYGAFRDYSSDPSLRVTLEEGAGLSHLREELRSRLAALQPAAHPEDLLERSVFADHTDVLPADARFYSPQVLSLIPPVCGG